MTDRITLIFGALLHDIGKVVYRAGLDPAKHAKSGADYLANTAKVTDKDLLDCVRYHHADALANARLAPNSPAYIVYMADNIASAVDRREDEEGGKGFAKDLPLYSIFNLLNGNNGKKKYDPYKTNVEETINFPTEEVPSFDESAYKKILTDITDSLKGMEWSEDYLHSLLEVLEAHLALVPSSTNKGEVADISLFNHQKLTAAFACAMADYLEEAGEQDYKKRLFTEGKSFYDEKAFLLTTLDLSGIQKFIYTIDSKDALKNLRARSFYLDFMTEHIAGCLLRDLGLPRANLMYSGGGRADLLVANTENTKETLQKFCHSVNSWFQENFDIALYMAVGFAEACANDLKNEPQGSYAELHRLRSESIAASKAHRYGAEEIIALNNRKHKEDARECKVCRRTDRLTGEDLCSICAALAEFSKQIIKDENKFFAALPGDRKGLLPLPGNYSLAAGSEEDARSWQKEGALIYGKNRFNTGKNLMGKLWVGDYHTGETFENLAKQSTGIKRLGIFRADVDNLGAAFALGFRRPDGDTHYETLSRTAELSRQLSLFFKLHIKKILANPEFTMTGKKKEKRHAAIVYSGGDDLFIVGAWDDVIELAVDIRRNFARYTENKNTLTISGGIGIYHPTYPISVMAEETARAEDKSKDYPGKNAITLPSDGGSYTLTTEMGEQIKAGAKLSHAPAPALAHPCASLDEGTYSWKILEEKVMGEKLWALVDFFGLPEPGEEKQNERGKNFLYNLLELLRGRSEKINLARYVYLLSRMEPDKEAGKEAKERYRAFADKMYRWYLKDEDTRQLKTAILLYAYLTRERNEDDGEQ